MRWPWSKRPVQDIGEAESAREQAEGKLENTRRQQQNINDVARELREFRKRNRFADMIQETMLPKPRDER